MNSSANPTPVRTDQRVQCALKASIRPNEICADAVRLARGAGEGDGSVKVTVVDASRQGLGMVSPVFMPRGAKVDVRVLLNGGAEITVVARVQRIEMRDRSPSYYLGLAISAASQPSGTTDDFLSKISAGEPTEESR